ncbi:MAG: ABC transporter substrate-binding protein [Methanomicrobiales archaeon]
MKKNQIIGLVIIGIILIGGGVWYLRSVQQPPQKTLTDITIAPGKGVQPTLLLVARDQGYFTQHGLNVTIIEFPSATIAMQNLLNRKFDIGYVNEYSLSEPALYNKKLRVIGTLSQSDTSFVVGRKDRGIIQISDLEGKKIGVTKGSIVEYFMDRFFIMNSLSMSNTTVIGKAQHIVDRFFLMSKGHNIVDLQGYRPNFKALSVEHDERDLRRRTNRSHKTTC